MEKNPNHKEEKKDKKELESEHTLIDNSKLNIQDPNENFLDIKNELIFFQEKSKKAELRKNIEEEIRFLKLAEEVSPEEVKASGIDFCIIADVSESMYPYRIYLKKSMYYAIKDVENLVYRSLASEDGEESEFPKFRIALVKYSDREQADTPGKVEVSQFVDYTSLDEICKKIDEIDIKACSIKKRSVFDGLKAAGNLIWEADSLKVILHYCADPQYGDKYTTNKNKMPENYDQFPSGITDMKVDDVLEPLQSLGVKYNFVGLTGRVLAYQSDISSKLDMDISNPIIAELS